MKHLLLVCLLPFAAQGMRRVKPKSYKPSTHVASFSQLSADLMIALKDVDLAKTRALLYKIGGLNRTFKDLQCLELEATTYLQALLYHQQEKSKSTARLVTQIEFEQYKAAADDAPQSKIATPSFSHQVILKHAKAIAIQEVVSHFFRERYTAEVGCAFTGDSNPELS